jgi:multiple sugar transport system ATP-binding protein
MKVKLSLRGVRKEFGTVVAVEDLSLDVEEGEFLSLLGPSGCGKSTTLAIIAGFESPSRGDVVVDGVRINDVPVKDRGIGLVFQDYAVFTRMSVFDNLAFGLRVRGVRRSDVAEAVDQIASLLGLTGLLYHPSSRLNMSELQRVALGRALVLKPSLLLLDEPLSNLDAAFRFTLRTELRRLQQELHQTVVYVTHDQVEAMSMSDRIAVMRAGRILQIGSPMEVFDRPASRFVAAFIGDPPINILPARIASVGGRLVAQHQGLAIALDGAHGQVETTEAMEMAFRPTDVIVRRDPFGADASEMVVDLVEPLGSETVVHLRVGGTAIRAVVPPSFAPRGGERVWVSIPPDRVHLVDATSGSIVR